MGERRYQAVSSSDIDTGGEEGEDRDGEPGRQRPYTVFERLGEVDSGLGLAFA